MKEIEEYIRQAGVTPTPVRVLVYKSLKESNGPLSLGDLETTLDSVDKSTISRTLTTFKERHLVHSFNDGSGSMKYEICTHGGEDEFTLHKDMHVHFRCEVCGETICLTHTEIPFVELPSGFKAKEVNYVVTGVCADCGKH